MTVVTLSQAHLTSSYRAVTPCYPKIHGGLYSGSHLEAISVTFDQKPAADSDKEHLTANKGDWLTE